MIVSIPWPTYPTLTPGGKPSAAKMAGKPIPWLSMNVVNNLPAPVYRKAKHLWREAAIEAALGRKVYRNFPLTVHVELFKRTNSAIDTFAILEGVKPILDGCVEAGLIPDDGPAYIKGGSADAVATKAWLGVELYFPEG